MGVVFASHDDPRNRFSHICWVETHCLSELSEFSRGWLRENVSGSYQSTKTSLNGNNDQ